LSHDRPTTQRDRLRGILADRPIVRNSELGHEVIAAQMISRTLVMARSNGSEEVSISGQPNREFSRGDGNHSNTVANFFSILKRGVIGTYHHWSSQHIHGYLAEFDFRYSTKNITDAERKAIALRNARGKRLTYRQPSSLAA
jgi:hypothetical protein